MKNKKTNEKIIQIYKNLYILFIYLLFYNVIAITYNLPKLLLLNEQIFYNKMTDSIIRYSGRGIIILLVVLVIDFIRKKKNNYYKIIMQLGHILLIITIIHVILFYY